MRISPQLGPQTHALMATWCPELFYGGARGGGKTFFSLLDFLQDVPTYGRHWQGIIFRRTLPELQDCIRTAQALYPQTGGQWFEQAKEFRWPNGAILRFRYLENIQDAMRYQGHQYTWICWEEITQWPTNEAYLMLFACLRNGDAEVPTKRIRSTGNPGGPGHLWVKERFVDPAPKGYEPIKDAHNPDWVRMYIPARVSDNKILLARDPEYINRLRMVGSPELVRMWLDGDFNVVAGAYFAQFGDRHIINPVEIPHRWSRYFGFDWGKASPFCGLWGAVSNGKDGAGKESPFPKGAILVYKEAYSKGLDNPEIAKFILSREAAHERDATKVADPSIFTEDGGPSIAEQLSNHGLWMSPADNTRIAGWGEIHLRLGPNPPAIYISTACPNLLSQIKTAQHDPIHPEDLDTEAEDHALDALRYLCMARPYAKLYASAAEAVTGKGKVNVAAMVKKARQARNRPRV